MILRLHEGEHEDGIGGSSGEIECLLKSAGLETGIRVQADSSKCGPLKLLPVVPFALFIT